MMQRTVSRTSAQIMLYIIILFIMLFSLGPILWVLLTSLKPAHLVATNPPVFFFKPTLIHYYDILTQQGQGAAFELWKYAINSIVTSLVSTVITVIVAIPAAYGLARLRFSGKFFFDLFILAARMLPPIGMVVPLFIFMYSLGLLDTKMSLILSYTALNVPLAVWMLRGFIEDIPIAVEEAAMADGCSRVQALFRILLPMMGSGLGATAAFIFFQSWNDYELALTLTGQKALTLPIAIKLFVTDEGIVWGAMSAASIVIIAPPLIMFLVSNKFIARGLTMGAVKG